MRLTEPAALPPAARMAASAAGRSKPSSVPVTTSVLPASGPASDPCVGTRGGIATTPTAASWPSSPDVLASAKKRPRLAATTPPMPGTSVKRPGSTAASSAAMRRVQSVSVSSGPGGQVVATHAARSMAVCSPTWRMPSAARMRESGRRRARSMAATRFSADFCAKRSSATRSSTVSRKKSAGPLTRPRASSWSSTANPAPSMSMPPRPTKCERPWMTCAGQKGLLQRCRTSPSSRDTGAAQTGQRDGISNSRSEPSRASGRLRTTSGMTSPALWSRTRSPMRTSLRRTSSRLWRVARATVEPATSTGRRCATGVSVPVRPT